jgi:hypothetical protein
LTAQWGEVLAKTQRIFLAGFAALRLCGFAALRLCGFARDMIEI